MKMDVQMSWCLGLLSWKVDGVCEWKWQAMVIHKTAFSYLAVLWERYNLITNLLFSHAQTGQRMFSIQYPIVPQFPPVCRVQGAECGSWTLWSSSCCSLSPWAGPCAGGTAQLHSSEGLCAFHVMPGSSGLGGGGGRGKQTLSSQCWYQSFPWSCKEKLWNQNEPECAQMPPWVAPWAINPGKLFIKPKCKYKSGRCICFILKSYWFCFVAWFLSLCKNLLSALASHELGHFFIGLFQNSSEINSNEDI